MASEEHPKQPTPRQIESKQGAIDALTVKNHGLVLLLSRAPVSVSPQDVPPLPAVEVELLVNKTLERARVSQRVRPLQGLRRVRDSKQPSVKSFPNT